MASDWSDVTMLASDWPGAGPGSAGSGGRVEPRVGVQLLQRGEARVTQRADVGPHAVHHLGVGVQMLKTWGHSQYMRLVISYGGLPAERRVG